MNYITVREAAEKWNISERLVQKYCSQGRIAGAGKFGVSWRIPENAVKPQDCRKSKNKKKFCERDNKTDILSNLMPLMNSDFEPGHCMEYIENMEGGEQKEIALAEYYYFSGCPEKAVEKAELFLNSSNLSLKLSACLICAYANLSIGQIRIARHSLSELKNTLDREGMNGSPSARAASAFVSAAAAVLLHLPLPENMPHPQEYLSVLPPGLQVFALYVHAHYTYLLGEYEKSLGIIETALVLQAKKYPISDIYLHLAAVMNHMSLKHLEEAQKHLLAAWELAYPDNLIEAFGEHHGLLGGTLEAVIKPAWPEKFKDIIAITYRFSEGWRKVHNPLTGHDVADNLTTTEFAAAMLAARGWTNQEIGEYMNISPNTVKSHISTALQKLNIRQRKDLKKYMLQ